MGLRWPVERTNSWLSNYGQLRRNTDRKTAHRSLSSPSRSPCSSPRAHRLAEPLVADPLTYSLRLLGSPDVGCRIVGGSTMPGDAT